MNIENLISKLKSTFTGSEFVYTNGSCYQLYDFMKEIFPEAKPLINNEGQHIIISVDDGFFDINGKVHDISDFRDMTEEEILYFTDRRCNIYSPHFFVPEWVEDSCIPFLQTASFAFNLETDQAKYGHKLVPIESEDEYDQIETALFSCDNDAYEPYTKPLQLEQKKIREEHND